MYDAGLYDPEDEDEEDEVGINLFNYHAFLRNNVLEIQRITFYFVVFVCCV